MNKKYSKDEEIYLPDGAQHFSDEPLLFVQITGNAPVNEESMTSL